MAKKSDQRSLVEKILQKSGKSYSKWSKDIIADSAMRLLKDDDKVLKEIVLKQAEIDLIINFANNDVKDEVN